jgi:hypothetical protein
MRERLSYDQLVEVAKSRHRIHTEHPTHRPLSEDYELIGLLGEEAFAWSFGLDTEYLDLKPQGDGRVDFHLPCGTVDVKTAEKPYNLLREVGKAHADILVLAGWNRQSRAIRLIGWEYDAEMRCQPSRDFGKGVINHYKHYTQLRPMPELKNLILGW